MRILLAFLLIFPALISDAQSRKQMKLHKAGVAASVKNKTPLISLDSFYCSGLKLATVKDRDVLISHIVFRHLKTNDTMIFVSLKDDGDSISPSLYYHFYFPALQSSCDMTVEASSPEFLMQSICKQGLLNTAGLDTFRAEAFVAIKGSNDKKQSAFFNFSIIERNRFADIVVKGHDIYQDTVIIGSFEEKEITGPGGVNLRQVQVYNTNKQVVCFSTEVKPDGHEWLTVTNKDGKYHTIRAAKSKEGDLYEIIRFLIQGAYL